MKVRASSTIVLFIIVLAQFCCTSLWFAGNAVIQSLSENFNLPTAALGHLTSAVQFGFISGTLVFAWFSIADRFSPSRVFLLAALIGSAANLGLNWNGNSLESLLIFRFLTGFFLAGIYPVGMKIASDHFDRKLGKSLGLLVGALVLGTAFPHLVKGVGWSPDYQQVIIVISGIAAIGGMMVGGLIGDGPYRKSGTGFHPRAMVSLFKNSDFRNSAFGYFGHMWELYAFWTFAPVILLKLIEMEPTALNNPSLWSFGIIAIGALGCVLAGFGSLRSGSKKMALVAVSLSGLCCLLSPFIFGLGMLWLSIGLLLFWGLVVIPDSPMFSTLVAQNSVSHLRGTALTLVNGIGFAITIVSIQLINWLSGELSYWYWLLPLAIGPMISIWSTRKIKDQ